MVTGNRLTNLLHISAAGLQQLPERLTAGLDSTRPCLGLQKHVTDRQCVVCKQHTRGQCALLSGKARLLALELPTMTVFPAAVLPF